MKKWIFVILFFLLSVNVLAGTKLFMYYDNDYTAKQIFAQSDLEDKFILVPFYNNLLERKNLDLLNTLENPITDIPIIKTQITETSITENQINENLVSESFVEKKNQNQNSEIIEVLITDQGIEPSEVVINVNQEISWKNKRKKLPALLMGLREINIMNSGFLYPEESFHWKIDEPGVYTYADGIVIGIIGKIVVNQ